MPWSCSCEQPKSLTRCWRSFRSILASRIRRLPRETVLAELGRLDPLVDKTGGPTEREAMAYIRAHVARAGA